MTVPCRPLEVPPQLRSAPGRIDKNLCRFFSCFGSLAITSSAVTTPLRRYTPSSLSARRPTRAAFAPRAPRRRPHADASGAPAGWNGRCSTCPTSREGVTSTRTLPIFWSSCRSVPSSGSCRHSRRDLAVDHARAHGWAARRQRLSQPPGGGEGLLFVLRHHGARQRGDPSGRA